MAKKVTIKAKKKGQSDISFKSGALHQQLGVDADDKIPESKLQEAAEGEDGPLARKRAMFSKNILTGKK